MKGLLRPRARESVSVLHPKIDVQITLLTFLRVVLVPSVAIASLVVSTTLFDVRFTDQYVALAIIAGLLTLLVIARDALLQANVVGARGLTLAGRIGVGWLAVVGLLVLAALGTQWRRPPPPEIPPGPTAQP